MPRLLDADEDRLRGGDYRIFFNSKKVYEIDFEL
jgi:hypothetical protein